MMGYKVTEATRSLWLKHLQEEEKKWVFRYNSFADTGLS